MTRRREHSEIALGSHDRAALCRMPLFQRLPETVRASLWSDARSRWYRKGAVVFEQGDRPSHFFAVLSGWVKLYRLQQDGTETVLEVFGPGQAFGEVAMYFSCGYPATAELVVDGRLASFPTASVVKLLQECPDLAEALLLDISAHLERFIDRVESDHCRTAPQRLAHFLLRFCPPNHPAETCASVELPYPKQLIANLLGMQPETFSRAVAALKRHGVAIDGKSFRIADPESLRRFVGEHE